MTPDSDREIEAVLAVIFAPDEDPMFVDGTAQVEEIVGDQDAFLKRATERFGFVVKPSDLKLTVHGFAELVKSKQADRE